MLRRSYHSQGDEVMRKVLILRGVAVWTAALSLLFPPQFVVAAGDHAIESQGTIVNTSAATAARETVRIRDVELGQHGQFVGQLVDAQGQPIVGAAVTLQNKTKQLQTTSNAQGQFQFTEVHGGTYHLQTNQSEQICRLWQNGTAPPKANHRMLLVQQGGQVTLGQNCGSPVCGSPVTGGGAQAKRILTHPLVIGGLVAAAIAIPVAIHNSDDDDPSS
jgi:hypothetical protein